MEEATAEEGPLMQKQLLCIECVLSQGLCSVICIPDFTRDQLIPIARGRSQY